MKYFLLLLLFFAGCNRNEPSPPTSSSTSPTPANKEAGNSSAIQLPAGLKEIVPVEAARDGKIYLFATTGTMYEFVSKDTAQPTVKEMPGFGVEGKTVIVHAADEIQAKQLLAGYKKQHSLP